MVDELDDAGRPEPALGRLYHSLPLLGRGGFFLFLWGLFYGILEVLLFGQRKRLDFPLGFVRGKVFELYVSDFPLRGPNPLYILQ